MSEIRVFISYAHDTPAHASRVLALAQRLRTDGLDCRIDQFVDGGPAQGWAAWMEEMMRWARFVLVVGSEAYLRRYERREAQGGLGATWEGAIVRRELYAQRANQRFVPVLLDDAPPDARLPEPLRDTTVYRLDADYEKLLRVLTHQPAVVAVPIGAIPTLPSSALGAEPIGVVPTRSSSALGPAWTARLVSALVAAFRDAPDALAELAETYEPEGLPALSDDASLAEGCRMIVEHSRLRVDSLLESVMRSARRRRPDAAELARAVADRWPFADGLDFTIVDELRERLERSGVTFGSAQQAALDVLGDERPPLWRGHGAEPLADLLEGLAQMRQRPLRLVSLARRHLQVDGVRAWIERVAPDAADAPSPAPSRRQRMLLLLRQSVNDRYSGEVYFADASGKPRFIADLGDQVPLAKIPDQFVAARARNDDLLTALLGTALQLIEVMLPVRDLLVPIEGWDLFGSGPIGESYPVVVRPLERAFVKRYDAYVGGAMILRESWKALHGTPIMRPVELEPAAVASAVLHHPKRWCVAAFRCPDPAAASRLDAIDLMVKRGVAAMLSVRHEAAWPDHLKACPTLPTAVHDHRCEHPQHPVALLWDDADFIPGTKQ